MSNQLYSSSKTVIVDRRDPFSKIHCKKALDEQIQILFKHVAESDEPDYEFIRNHAMYIVQFSDQMMYTSASAEVV